MAEPCPGLGWGRLARPCSHGMQPWRCAGEPWLQGGLGRGGRGGTRVGDGGRGMG